MAHKDTFGPFQTKVYLLGKDRGKGKDKVGLTFEQKIIFLWPKTSRLTISDHFGMLTSLQCLVIFVGAFFWDTLYLVYLEVERLVLGPGRKTKARLPASSKTGKCLGNIGRHLVHFCQR